MSLEQYLAQKPLYYEQIDYERFPRIFKAVSSHFKRLKIIHIVGTNGKGSTGRFLAQMLELEGFSVGHYTSPHILEFNERIYKNGNLITHDELEVLHARLLGILGGLDKELSYFEYATLLAYLAFEDTQWAIFEAGVGGEFDATNALLSKVFSIVTPISLDHQNLLGNTIRNIAFTKLQSVENIAVVAPQEYDEAMEVIRAREAILQTSFVYADTKKRAKMVDEYAKKHNLSAFLKQNLFTAYKAAFLALGYYPDISKMGSLSLRGRCEKIAPNITLDVGHNVSAAKALARHFRGKKVVLIYNAYKDKDFLNILKILRPIIKSIELVDIINIDRPNAKSEIKEYAVRLGIECSDFEKIKNGEEYLVFGSFGVAESFLKRFYER